MYENSGSGASNGHGAAATANAEQVKEHLRAAKGAAADALRDALPETPNLGPQPVRGPAGPDRSRAVSSRRLGPGHRLCRRRADHSAVATAITEAALHSRPPASGPPAARRLRELPGASTFGNALARTGTGALALTS